MLWLGFPPSADCSYFMSVTRNSRIIATRQMMIPLTTITRLLVRMKRSRYPVEHFPRKPGSRGSNLDTRPDYRRDQQLPKNAMTLFEVAGQSLPDCPRGVHQKSIRKRPPRKM